MDRFVRTVRAISTFLGWIAAGLIGLGVLVVCHMVFVRYVLGHNTIWQTDFVTYSLVAATFIGSPYVLLTRGHVNVDILPLHLGQRARYWLALFTAGLSFAFVVVLLILVARYWHEAFTGNWRSDTVWRARLWIPYSAMPLGLGLLALQYVAEIIAIATHRQPPFGMAPEVPIA